MKAPKKEIAESDLLLKVLTTHFHSLASAKCDDALLKQYSALLRFLKSKKGIPFDEWAGTADKHRSKGTATLSAEQLRRMTLEDLEKLVNDEEITRANLEFVAIERFSVPRGSMRSFSNREMLIAKLRTLIANERTHQTIGAVARGEGKEIRES
jgi:hypothetical protein